MTPTRTPGGAEFDDVWKAPTAATSRAAASGIPPMPPPTGPRVALPTPGEKRQGARRTLVIVGIVAGALVLVGVVFARIAAPVVDAQRAKAADIEAMADVALLGKHIATYFIDGEGPAPDIAVIDGRYHLDIASWYGDNNDAPVSPGVEFGGVTGTGNTDWCVWVTNPHGTVKTFEYSAANGLRAGSC